MEYCSVIYHPLLTLSQSEQLERLQKITLRIIFGFDRTYEDVLALSNLKTLEERRKNAFLKFAKNLAESERYKDWFPVNNNSEYNLRETKTYMETFARTQRLYNSPIFSMRRALNEEI